MSLTDISLDLCYAMAEIRNKLSWIKKKLQFIAPAKACTALFSTVAQKLGHMNAPEVAKQQVSEF